MSEFTGGIDEEIGAEEKEKSEKITSALPPIHLNPCNLPENPL